MDSLITAGAVFLAAFLPCCHSQPQEEPRVRIKGSVVDTAGKPVTGALVLAKCNLGDGVMTGTTPYGQTDEGGRFEFDMRACPPARLVVEAARSELSDVGSFKPKGPLTMPIRITLPDDTNAVGQLDFIEQLPPGMRCTKRTIELYRDGSININPYGSYGICGRFQLTVRAGTYRIVDSVASMTPMMEIRVEPNTVHTVWLNGSAGSSQVGKDAAP